MDVDGCLRASRLEDRRVDARFGTRVQGLTRQRGTLSIDGDDATRAIGWLMDMVVQSIRCDQPPPTS